MTLDEKVGQLNFVPNGPAFDRDAIRRGGVGAVLGFNNAEAIAEVRALARASRLKIPPLVSLDVVHGFRTLFPIPLAEAATFDLCLARTASWWAAREAAANGIDWNLGPMVDVSRDIRWGRIVEGAGEDPYLGTAMARARVEGFRAGGVAVSAKHFAGYGASRGGRDYDAADIGPAELRDVYLPPFRGAIAAGAESLMSAFTALDGTPATANSGLLTDIARKQWAFDGIVVSDYDGVAELLAHGVAADGSDAARKAILAGVDMDMTSGLYARFLAEEVRAGRVPGKRLDQAVRRVLRVKARLGLFDKPDPDPEHADESTLTPAARDAARRVARDSLVLLQNRDAQLPISPGVRSIAVVGAFATSARDQLGPHEARGDPREATTVLSALDRRAGADGIAVGYAPGCDLHCARTDGFREAVDLAQRSDLVVAVMGEPRDMTGEGGSRAHLGLPGRQRELVEALVATGRPVVLVLIAGRPLELGSLIENVPAILMAWYPGTEGGPAVADVLFGDEGPSGKLPHTWPRTVGQVPLHYDALPSGRPTREEKRFTLKYVDEKLSPQFPFGWGLSYTDFRYSDVHAATPQAPVSGTVKIRATVANAGRRSGKEVVQLYVRDLVAARSRPVRQLKGFEKVALRPGESREITFEIPAAQLGFHLSDGTYVVEPGVFEFWVGGNSQAGLGGRFELTGAASRPAPPPLPILSRRQGDCSGSTPTAP